MRKEIVYSVGLYVGVFAAQLSHGRAIAQASHSTPEDFPYSWVMWTVFTILGILTYGLIMYARGLEKARRPIIFAVGKEDDELTRQAMIRCLETGHTIFADRDASGNISIREMS